LPIKKAGVEGGNVCPKTTPSKILKIFATPSKKGNY